MIHGVLVPGRTPRCAGDPGSDAENGSRMGSCVMVPSGVMVRNAPLTGVILSALVCAAGHAPQAAAGAQVGEDLLVAAYDGRLDRGATEIDSEKDVTLPGPGESRPPGPERGGC